uniref:Uncharacterized protein n=1 Tax=Arundo donax TaxID=35708 RepID=A0A0A8Y1F3_ARUDO
MQLCVIHVGFFDLFLYVIMYVD